MNVIIITLNNFLKLISINMQNIKLWVVGVLSIAITLFSFNQVFGQETFLRKVESGPVAMVDIADAKIVSQEGNLFKISFKLKNGQGLQTDVRYSVVLTSKDGKYVLDDTTYDESVTLYENSSIDREISYTAPSNFTGSYKLNMFSSNSNGFPFSLLPLGEVKLVSSTKGVSVSTESCYVTINGDTSGKKYNLSNNIFLTKDQSLKLSCSVSNTKDSVVTVSPMYETKFFGSYGEITSQEGGDSAQIIFSANEKKTITLSLPKGSVAKNHFLAFWLDEQGAPSNQVYVHYTVEGINASLQKITLDKDYYKRGDTGVMAIIWNASHGMSSKNGKIFTKPPVVTLSASLVNGKGRTCAEPIEQKLEKDMNAPETMLIFNIKYTCANPTIKATLIDATGNILDQKEFSFTSSEESINLNSGKFSTGLIVLLIIIILVIIFYLRRRGNTVNQ